MKNIYNQVYSHDTEVDLTHKINTSELNNWIAHLQYTKKELNHLVAISNGILEGKFADSFEEKHNENYDFLNLLTSYKNSRDSITECEDTECDMAFISDHENFRKGYTYYLENYRKIKDSFFEELRAAITSKK